MNKWVEDLKNILRYFTIITVAIMVVSASYISVFYGVSARVEVTLLWQILLVAFLCAFSCLFFKTKKGQLKSGAFVLRWFICYIYVNVVVMISGVCFEWFDPGSLPMLIGMVVAILIAFAFIAVIVFLIDLKTTDEINRKLRERNGKE